MRLTRRSLFAAFASALGLAAMPAVSEASVVTDTMPTSTTNYSVSRFYFDDAGNIYRERHSGLTADEAFDLGSLPRTAYTSKDCSAGSCGRAAVRGPAKVIGSHSVVEVIAGVVRGFAKKEG